MKNLKMLKRVVNPIPNIMQFRYFHHTNKWQSNAGTSGEIISFKLADIGEGIHEVELLKWFVNQNDKVKTFDKLCLVQSDKATVEITSRYDGVIKSIFHEEGAIVKVGDVLVDIESVNKPVAASLKFTTSQLPPSDSPLLHNSDVSDKDNKEKLKVYASPAVRKIAKENSIDIQGVVGSGWQGRVLKDDIQKVVSITDKSTDSRDRTDRVAIDDREVPTPSRVSIYERHPHVNDVVNANQSHGHRNTNSEAKSSVVGKVVPIRGVQRIMVNAMTAAAQIKHLTFCDEIDVSSLVKLKRQLSADVGNLYSKRNLNSSSNTPSLKIGYLPILVKMVSLSLLQFPMLNATVNSNCTEIIHHNHHNISILMDTPKGLVDPVISRVNEKSITEIAMDLELLQAAALSGTLKESDFRGGTFSISNIGSIGGTYTVPVVNVPEVAIGALGRIQYQPRYVTADGELASLTSEENEAKLLLRPVPVMCVSWSADHRVIAGADVAKFSNLFKGYVEQPSTMLGHLK